MKNKVTKFLLTTVQLLCMMAVTTTFFACEEEDEDEEGRPYYTRFVDINITRCERVGSVLVVDYEVSNKQDTQLTVEFWSPIADDNLGNHYNDGMGVVTLALASGEYSYRTSATISGKGKIEGHAKVRDFDATNKAGSVKLSFAVGIQGQELADKDYEQSAKVVDNRVLSHGVQTNDTGLSYEVTSCKRQANDEVNLEFSVTNNTGQRLADFGMGYAFGGEAKVYDNLGNGYDSSIRFAEGDWYHNASTDLTIGGSVSGTLRVRNVKANATELTVVIGATAGNYIVSDEQVRFLDIAIQE